MPILLNKITVYVPSKFLNTTDLGDVLDAIVRAAGGVTIGNDNHGYWVDPITGEVVTEAVSTVTALFTHEDKDEMTEAVAGFVKYLKANGEQAVLVEVVTTDDGDTSWCAALY